jgi:tetratricopeptide (TPR) repeat protein
VRLYAAASKSRRAKEETTMRTRMIGATAVAAFLLAGTAAFSMGGGGGGGYGGGFGPMGGQATFDDYAIAVRLIHHAEYAEAIPHLESALAQRPHDADVLNYLGYTHRMVGDYSGSLDYYKRALAIDPDHKGAHEYLGELYLQMHDQPSAQKELETLASLCPDGCDERDALTKALATYTPGAAPTGAAAPAATPTSATTQ